MQFTEQQLELQRAYATDAMAAVGAIQSTIIAVATAQKAIQAYLNTLEEPEERDTWQRALDGWTATQQRLNEAVRILTQRT